ncbi:MAG: hypothetical protein KH366_17510 [Clostridiaceae bacterium]|nr:hypothetical protein [Clostridiaceae bacterium]
MNDKRQDECPRCGLSAVSDSDYHQSLQTYISGIDPDIRTSDTVYSNRLKACGVCSYLSNGLCRLCGCFVEMRAAKQNSRCPETPSKWEN